MGTVRVTHNVEVTRLDPTDAAVIATHLLPLGERVLLEMSDERGGVSNARLMRTVKSRLVLRDGRVRREFQLSIIGQTDAAEPSASTEPTTPTRAPLVATVSRRMPVRLVEVSASGCLWDAAAPLDEGSVGFVEVRTPRHHHSEAIRIVRTFRAADSNWPYRMAVQFLTLAPLLPESLRGVAAIVATGAPYPHRS